MRESVTDRELASRLRGLEERLLDPAIRHSHAELSQLLADGFVEIGRSGRLYDKQAIIQALAGEPVAESAPIAEIADYAARKLAPGVVLMTYLAVERGGVNAPARSSRRCSIWRLIDSRWQMIFHQGTPIAE